MRSTRRSAKSSNRERHEPNLAIVGPTRPGAVLRVRRARRDGRGRSRQGGCLRVPELPARRSLRGGTGVFGSRRRSFDRSAEGPSPGSLLAQRHRDAGHRRGGTGYPGARGFRRETVPRPGDPASVQRLAECAARPGPCRHAGEQIGRGLPARPRVPRPGIGPVWNGASKNTPGNADRSCSRRWSSADWPSRAPNLPNPCC